VAHFIYLLETNDLGGNAFLKIGKTNNLKRRIEMLQTGCPFQINLVLAFEFEDSARAHFLEKDFHQSFTRQRTKGEWYISDRNKWGDPVLSVIFSRHFQREGGKMILP
jgi:hypothetical protein